MRIFVDSAKLDEIKAAASYGILDGITTNPSLIKRAVEDLKSKGENVDMKSYITKLLKSVDGPVSLEVIGTDYESMVSEAKKLFKMFNGVAGNVWIKIPVNTSLDGNNNFDGIKAIKELSDEGIPINCTLVFTPEQALLAAKAGATVVSPFAGRVDDYIRSNAHIEFKKEDYFLSEGCEKDGLLLEDNGIVSGIDLVAQCVQILKLYNMKTEVLAASLRNPRQVREAALVGAHIATIPSATISSLASHPKTIEGMKKFAGDVVFEYKKLFE